MDDATAENQTPNFVDLTLFFVGNSAVQQVEPITLSDGSALSRSFTVPNAVSRVYAIGNTSSATGAVGSPATLPTVGAAESTVKGLAMELDKQTSFQVVNLSNGQGGGNDGTTAYSGATSIDDNGTETYRFNVYPAFARYEIKEVSANPSATKPLTGFDLTGIFITNTYRTIGITEDGRRILRFEFDHTRPHSKVIEEMGSVIIIESKSIAQYLKQLEGLGEDSSEYATIWGYSAGSLEPRSPVFEGLTKT